MSIQENNYYLMQVLNFTPQELAVNSSGALSDGQRSRLQEKMGQYKQSGTKVIAVVLLMTAIAFAGVFFFSDTGARLRETLTTNPIFPLILGGTLLIWAIMIIFALAKSSTVNFDKAKLMVVTGKANPKKINTYYGPAAVAMAAAGPNPLNCTVKVGRVQFYVDEETFRGFAKGLNYRVYYIPYGRIPLMISAEALEANLQ